MGTMIKKVNKVSRTRKLRIRSKIKKMIKRKMEKKKICNIVKARRKTKG